MCTVLEDESTPDPVIKIEVVRVPPGTVYEEDEVDEEIEDSVPVEIMAFEASASTEDPGISSEIPESDPQSADSQYFKPPLNRRSRRRLAQQISARTFEIHINGHSAERPLIELRKLMARPPGCTFLGSKPVQTWASVNGLDINPLGVLVDTGSDITLISRKALDDLDNMPKSKFGQQIDLIQVTGRSGINYYVNYDLYFHTPDGPVKINVDAYVVKGMSTPFILGNDFTDQHSISVMKAEGNTYVVFGESGRKIQVRNSITPSMLDEDGHTFQVGKKASDKDSDSQKEPEAQTALQTPSPECRGPCLNAGGNTTRDKHSCTCRR
jgi:hypothetical protein